MITRIWQHSGFRYLLVGGTSFLIDAGILALLHEVLGVPVPIATAVAFLVSFVFNYTAQRRFAFGSDVHYGRGAVKYAVLVAVNTLVTVGIVTLAEPTAIGWFGGKIVATIITTIGNYLAYRFWIFPAERRQDPKE